MKPPIDSELWDSIEELIEREVATRLNAKAGRTVYDLSGRNPEAHPLDCTHCITDLEH
jgi:hypothetical protein